MVLVKGECLWFLGVQLATLFESAGQRRPCPRGGDKGDLVSRAGADAKVKGYGADAYPSVALSRRELPVR